ncbi:MAG: hypothetical protein ABEJ62_02160, partial [Candidatus Nanohaloarchaea archaeon]
VNESGDTMTGNLDLSGNILQNVDSITGSSSNITVRGNLDMNGNALRNIADPSGSSDALSLGFGDTRYLQRSGDSMSGALDLAGNTLQNVGGLGNGGSAVPVNDALDLQGNAVQNVGSLTLGWSNLTSYPGACPDGEAVAQVGDTLTCISIVGAGAGIYVNESGDSMSGDLNMSGNLITDIGAVGGPSFTGSGDLDMQGENVSNLPTPVGSAQAMTLGYATTHYVSVTGDKMEGDLDLLGNDLRNVNSIGNTSYQVEFTSSVNMTGNNITNFFDTTACGSNQAVGRVFKNGSYQCVGTGGGLETTLSINNSAGSYNLDMNGNSLLNVNTVGNGGTTALDLGTGGNVNISNGNLKLFKTPSGADDTHNIQFEEDNILPLIDVWKGRIRMYGGSGGAGTTLAANVSSGNVEIPNGNLNMSGNELQNANATGSFQLPVGKDAW